MSIVSTISRISTLSTISTVSTISTLSTISIASTISTISIYPAARGHPGLWRRGRDQRVQIHHEQARGYED